MWTLTDYNDAKISTLQLRTSTDFMDQKMSYSVYKTFTEYGYGPNSVQVIAKLKLNLTDTSAQTPWKVISLTSAWESQYTPCKLSAHP